MTPHGYCLAWNAWLVSGSVLGDGLTFLSYMVISIGLLRFCPQDKPPSLAIVLFATFIFFCGFGHALDILTIWIPIYELTVAVRIITGAASISVAYLMIFHFGQIFLYFREVDREYGRVDLPPDRVRKKD